MVQTELETFLARAQARERPVPRFVERELRGFLRCDTPRLNPPLFVLPVAIAECVVERPGKPAEVTTPATPAGSKGGEGDS